jgi:hypothetical protein
MKKYTLQIIIIIVLSVMALSEVIYIAARNGDSIVSDGSDVDYVEEKVREHKESRAERDATNPVNIPREPEDDITVTEPDSEYDVSVSENFGESGEVVNLYVMSSTAETYNYNVYVSNNPLPNGVSFEYVYLDDDNYVTYLKEHLQNNETADADEKVDLFLLKPEFAADVLGSEYVMSLSELGITETELSDQFDFAKYLMSDVNGVQKGFMYKLYPEVFIYRKSIAKSVLGTDDPEKIAEYIKDTETFEETAEKMKKSGYFMLGSYEEEIQSFLGNDKVPSIYENGEVVVPPSWKQWAEHAKSYIDKGYTIPDTSRSEAWSDGIRNGTAFGYIGNSYYAEIILRLKIDDDTDWSICPLPNATFSSGYILCAAKGTDNPEIAADIMRDFINDKENLKLISLEDNALTNSVSAMNELADENGAAGFMGGNETLRIYIETAEKITNAHTTSSHYNDIFESYVRRIKSYLAGEKTYVEALERFVENAANNYPEVQKTIAEIEADKEREKHAITAYYIAEEGATREEIETARDIMLDRLEIKGFYDSECGIDYSSGKITITFYYPKDLAHAANTVDDIAKPTMEGSDDTLNITIEKDDFSFNPFVY